MVSRSPILPQKKATTKKTPMQDISVIFRGVRGTLPTPGAETLHYGGNTSCIEIQSPLLTQSCLFLDAGTGIIKGAEEALQKGIREFHIILSHFHYDHLLGLTRFMPIFRKDCKIHIYSHRPPNHDIRTLLRAFFSHPLFPLDFDSLGSINSLTIQNLDFSQNIKIGPFSLQFCPLNHPQEAMATLIQSPQGTQIVYATDHEEGTELDAILEKFIFQSDLLILDTTFCQQDYMKGWGHSTARFAASLAQKAQIKELALFHYDPSMDDFTLEENLLIEAQKIFPPSFLSKEGCRWTSKDKN